MSEKLPESSSSALSLFHDPSLGKSYELWSEMGTIMPTSNQEGITEKITSTAYKHGYKCT